MTFYVDGRRSRLTKANGSGRWVLPMNVKRFAFGTHRVRVTVEFAKSSHTKARTLRLSFNRATRRSSSRSSRADLITPKVDGSAARAAGAVRQKPATASTAAPLELRGDGQQVASRTGGRRAERRPRPRARPAASRRLAGDVAVNGEAPERVKRPIGSSVRQSTSSSSTGASARAGATITSYWSIQVTRPRASAAAPRRGCRAPTCRARAARGPSSTAPSPPRSARGRGRGGRRRSGA